MTTLPTHLHQFLSAFVPWCEAHGGADYAEISATIAALGVQLTPEQVEAIGHTPPPGEPLYRPAEQVPSRTADDISPPPAPGQAFVVEPNEAPPVRYAKSGLASRVFPSIPRVLETVAKRIPNVLAHRVEPPGVPAAEAGKVEWLTWTWEQYAAEMKAVAKSLIAIGMNSFESVAICGFNHPCWFFMHVGALAANGLSAGTYPTNSAEACAFIAQDARCRVAAVDTVANMRKYLAMKDELPLLKHVVIWGSEGVPADVKAAHGDFVITYDEFKALGNRVTDDEYQARTNLVEAKNCAILIYTSGTTGTPKGVMASHDNMLIASLGTISWLRWPKEVKENHMVSFLPLSHIAAQVLDFGIPLAFGLEGFDITVTSARPDALKGTLGATLVAVRPTFFFGVPRVYEKFVEGIKAKSAAAASTTPKTIRQLTGFGAEVGVAAARATSTDGDGKMPFGYEVVKKAVHAKVLAALGLDRAVVTLTGAAPITRQTLEFMAGMGVVIHEVFGMSETSGMGSCSTFQYFAFGSCGVVQHPYEMKIEHVPGRDKEGEGEICLRGRNIMLGYLRNPEKTRETIGDDGWLHSGDQGRIDERGRVYITGRIKELIIGAGGENIAPVPIETKLKELLPALSNAVLIGDQRKYNTLLVTLKTQPDLDTGFFKDNLVLEAAAVNPEVKTVAEAQRDATWTAYIEKGIKTYNEHFAISNAAKVQKFRILPTDLSLPGGELTSTLKLRRAILVEKYATLIDEMYAD